MRRKKGKLIPIEQSILWAAMDLRGRGEEEFHGFGIAKEIRDQKDARLLTGHGTLYRALGRLVQMGFLESRWEDPQIALDNRRPVRKLYRLTPSGVMVHSKLVEHSGLSNFAFGASTCQENCCPTYSSAWLWV